MARLSVVLLAGQEDGAELANTVRRAAEEHDFGFDSETGSLEEHAERITGWTVPPEILILNIPVGRDARDAIEELGKHMPEGEAKVILIGVENDIRIYRDLRELGVMEVFDEIPDIEELSRVFQEIANRWKRDVGIDPRRTVYVWSACGGAGGSMHAMAFARHFSSHDRRTLYLDLDLATAPASMFFAAERGARETPGLLEALTNPSRIDALLLERTIQPAGKNLFYLSARLQELGAQPLSSAVSTLISRAQMNFDMVVVDTPWRALPEPDFTQVYGPSYIVAPPTPAGLLGFTVLARDLGMAPTKSPIVGIVNRIGEKGSNDIPMEAFREEFSGQIMKMPYDASFFGRLFFEQKTMLDARGRVGRSVQEVIGTLQAASSDERTRRTRSLRFWEN